MTETLPDDTAPDVTQDESTADETTVVEETAVDTDGDSIRQYLAWGALAVLSLLAVVALIQFYSSVGAAIDLWVASEYQPIMRAVFNLAVLLLAVGGVSWLVRELA